MYQDYKDKGFSVLGFPCNQFGKQEPGSADEISDFCQINYGVSFPMHEKIDVKGPNADPIYAWLTSERPGILGTKAIKWNFTKFLINRNGEVVGRYGPNDKPEKIAKDIEALL